MNADDREAMLARIRGSLRVAYLPGEQPSIPTRAVTPTETDVETLAEAFTREAQAVGGEVYRPATQAEAVLLILQLIREVGGENVLAWAESELPVPEIGEALQQAGVRSTLVNLSVDPAVRRTQMEELDRPLVGLTGALAGLADTGSLALLSAPTRPRAASLLPLVHIALLPLNRLYPTMVAFLAAHPGLTRDSSNLVFITGPSRTADIEMVITRGVHGPKRLCVVLTP